MNVWELTLSFSQTPTGTCIPRERTITVDVVVQNDGEPDADTAIETSPEQRPDLGPIGIWIRDQVDSRIEKQLFEHYWLGRITTIELTEGQFGRIVDVVSGLPQPDAEAVSLAGEKLLRKQFGVPVGEFDAAFGTGSVFYDKEGRAVGFYDRYNFDRRWRGSLRPTGRVIGLRAACVVAGNCMLFDITYGQYVKP